jgi:hypothetical protein
MLQTRTLLNTRFPQGISNVIVSYIVSRLRDWWSIAYAGEYETCLDMPMAETDRGLYGACYGGHIEIARLMITRGATDLNHGLYNACLAGHKEI